ncbi:acyltransferase ChoActase/COT/CPT [Basidiobolus meristosporus CBS 931.73]|uniref:Carnitine O-acetyltransferase, mitochondrial n=1 Tax=Basidiobolus meristosporus CBS 931.73 TaxID=1314790 RepID=A0A1Y1Z400_9FUNG|nr:acyltransferase ChoActase/COT/CPT [Basidiobolus meristosporus CBS 931.73]|eukprot:ORY04936.1 acyltransferase ChoActase/COT/CPT [Basidiobolus meristosporus CBS 931.73]
MFAARSIIAKAVKPQYKRLYTLGAQAKQAASVESSRMYQFQKSLPRLPVPALADTCSKYLRSVRPLLDDAKYAQTEAAVDEFQKSGVGAELQRRLEAKAADPKCVNWLEDWWNDLAYMGYRDPLVPYVSYFFTYKDDPRRKSQVKRAASILTAAMEFRQQVITGDLEPERTKAYPFCMYSYKYMFNACRIPKKPIDYEVTFDPNANTHIAVARKNKFYILDMFHNGQQLSAAEIESQLERIIADAGNEKGPALGVLTCDNRDTWTDARDLLIKSAPENEKLLEKLESATLLLCLDDTAPVTRDEHSWACWGGDGRNRYFDKSLQFFVFENGKAGFLAEHSSMDGTPNARLNDYILNSIAKDTVNYGSEAVRPELQAPEQLKFALNDEVLKTIKASEANFDNTMGKQELSTLAYHGYGKNLIKKFRSSPDAFVQMIIQLAYYKMYGTSGATYEAATTRKFEHGRTETGRTVSNESVAFVKAMEDVDAPNDQKVALARSAMDGHVKYLGAAAEGQGVDRHLFGLRLSLRPDEPKPSIFTDEGYTKSTHWKLSTSQLASEHFDNWGFGEVVPDGFGIGYIIKNNAIHFNVTSMHLGSKTLNHLLAESAEQMKQVFEEDLAKQASKPKL